MFATEHHFHTYEQVKGHLAAARKIVAELELDDDLRVPAFVKAAELLAAKQVFFEQAGFAHPNMGIPKGR